MKNYVGSLESAVAYRSVAICLLLIIYFVTTATVPAKSADFNTKWNE